MNYVCVCVRVCVRARNLREKGGFPRPLRLQEAGERAGQVGSSSKHTAVSSVRSHCRCQTPCTVSLCLHQEFDLSCQTYCQFVPRCPQLEASTHTDTHTHSSSCIVPPGVPVAQTLPYRGCDKETMIYLLGITTNLLVLSRASHRLPVCVSVCAFLCMCLESELPGPVTHTSVLHACVLSVCFQ